ncbi:MAG: hypothetical protein A2171_01525 [Candidatus Levybacteria bacterium RBG_13_35_9]|nr:MAG: hypothetical protein A2171_01525 [Candidatus Levybacteria bacterium RBG_13_35_9]
MKKIPTKSYLSPWTTIRRRLKERLRGAGLLLVLFIFLFFQANSYAQSYTIKGGLGSTVSGTVGKYYLNITGYIAPFASIILTSDGIFLRATTADENGYFSFTDILIKEGFSKFCFDATDSKNYGKSYSCMSIPPAMGDVTITDVFLPPTLGLVKSEIAQGSSAIARGYSMPGALVTLHVGDKTYSTYADENGYYEFVIKDLKPGTYQVYATASLSGKNSLEPQKKLTLKVLSGPGQLINFLKELLDKIIRFFTSIALGPLWLAIPILILIIILLKKLFPAAFTSISIGKFFIFFPYILHRKKKHLHHEWIFGY